MISVQGLGAEPLYRKWRDRFADAIDGRMFTIEHLDTMVLGWGVAQIMVGEEAAIVFEIKHLPGCKVIEGILAAGDLGEIVGSLIPAAEELGRRNGCAFATIASREGWQKVLKQRGYAPHQITLIKEL